MPGLWQAGDVVDLDYPPFFIDRVEDAVPPGPRAPQIRRPVRERLRRPRLTGELADSVPERSDTDGIAAEESRRLVERRSAISQTIAYLRRAPHRPVSGGLVEGICRKPEERVHG